MESSNLGLWVVIIVIGFVIGNLMGAKPKTSEVRLGQLRLLARSYQLIPKLIPPPKWLPSPTTPMVAQYTRINDQWQLPFMCYYAQDGKWHLASSATPSSISIPESYVEALGNLAPYVQGLTIKSNSISIIWRDTAYSAHFSPTTPKEQVLAQMHQDINTLCAYLDTIAHHHHPKSHQRH